MLNNKMILLVKLPILIVTAYLSNVSYAAEVTSATTIIKSDHYSLTNNLFNDGSVMTYDENSVEVNGAAFSLSYIDQGGSGMDSYVQGTVGGVKASGSWKPGSVALTGMPVQIANLDDSLRLQWKTFQQNSNDSDDKWWATINVIFDAGNENLEPVDADRDYDLVIKLESFKQDSFEDKEKADNNSYWWFARNADSSLHPFSLTIDNVEYQWAVRYKFFQNSGTKDNKVHIKFIPIDNSNVAPYLDHSLKLFVDVTKEYLNYIELPVSEQKLATEKVAASNLWVKSVRAGYELYTGQGTYGNEYFKTVVDTLAPSRPENFVLTVIDNDIELAWHQDLTDSIEEYRLYRSKNGEKFQLLASNLYASEYLDESVEADLSYEYYVVAIDRSFNESASSDITSVNVDESTPVETDPVETTPVETTPVETEPVETEPVEEEKSSSGGSIYFLLLTSVMLLSQKYNSNSPKIVMLLRANG